MKKEIKLQRLYDKINKLEIEILAIQDKSDLAVTLADLVDMDRLDNEGGRPVDVLSAPDGTMEGPVVAAVHDPFVFSREDN
ncbi:MAG: hypothetical protein IH932_01330 [Thaumarchaeota archaeon]|nr:hypothetical protein [Nitrososphaerota archaeon]